MPYHLTRVRDCIHWLRSCLMQLLMLLQFVLFLSPLQVKAQTALNSKAPFESVINQLISSQHIPGLAVGIVAHNRIVYLKGFGRVNNQNDMIGEQTIFHLASISKTFVATAIMQLVERGKFSLDKPVKTYLPYFELQDKRAATITVRQLLNHTSGIPDDYSHDWETPGDAQSLEHYVRALHDKELDFDPGSQYGYSNTGYEILGDVIAKVSGMAFEDYIEKEILKPLGMEASSFLMKQWETGRIAAPYSVDSVYEISPRKTYPYNRAYAPSSTMHSRAYEMCLYALAHLNHGQLNGTRILDESAYAHMWTPTSSEISHMGLGWFLGDHRGYKTVSHSGGDPGFSTNLVLIPDERTAVIVLSNYDRASVIPLSDALVDIALGLEPEPLTVRKEELDRAIYKALATGGSEAARTKFQELKSTQPNFDFTQVRQLMSLSSNLKHAGRAADAIVVDELNIMTFRPFAFLYNNLAETCLLAGDTTKALANFEKVLELSPQHSNAQKRVQQLKN